MGSNCILFIAIVPVKQHHDVLWLVCSQFLLREWLNECKHVDRKNVAKGRCIYLDLLDLLKSHQLRCAHCFYL